MRERRKILLWGMLVALSLLATACPQQGDDADPKATESPQAAGTGANYYGWANEEATKAMKDADSEVDETKRAELMAKVGKLAGQDIASIPFYAKPQILVYNSQKLAGDFNFNAGQLGFGGILKTWSFKDGRTKQLVFAAEQWPECLNWVTACYSASWLHYTVLLTTQPQMLTLDGDNNYIPGIVTEIPTLENGGVTKEPFTVTYNINPKAVWDDGSPITGKDVKFTWDAIMKTPDSQSKVGYEDIESIEGDAQKVTIKFKKPFAPWKDLFGGGGQYVLKAAAFNNDSNVTGKMANELGFSGNAFKLDSFTESEMVLSRNPKYWGEQPKLDKVIFKAIPKTNDEVAAFKTGEIQAFYPQPNAELVTQIKAIPGGEISAKAGTVYEGLWLNLDADPVKDKAVREALLYGVNRQAVIDTVVKPIDPNATVNTCLFSVPNLAGGKWCGKDFPTEYSKEKAIAALEKGGWKKNVDPEDKETIVSWTKGGKRLVIPLATTSGNVGREQAQLIIQRQLSEIGIELRIDNSLAGILFQTRLPARDFTVGMFAQVATPDPSTTANWAADQIPCKYPC